MPQGPDPTPNSVMKYWWGQALFVGVGVWGEVKCAKAEVWHQFALIICNFLAEQIYTILYFLWLCVSCFNYLYNSIISSFMLCLLMAALLIYIHTALSTDGMILFLSCLSCNYSFTNHFLLVLLCLLTCAETLIISISTLHCYWGSIIQLLHSN